MLIIRSWPCPKCTFKLLYISLSPYAWKIHNASGARQSQKVRDISKWTKPIVMLLLFCVWYHAFSVKPKMFVVLSTQAIVFPIEKQSQKLLIGFIGN